MSTANEDQVSRRRFEREKAARQEAERLLEEKSRALYLANEKLNAYSEELEKAVLERTADMRRALQKAEAAAATRSRFLATMSHEIRTPLGGLLGMIDLVYGDETNPETREYLEYAKTSGQALKRIVNDVLDFSKMEAGAFQFENEKVDIRALISSVVGLAGGNLGSGESRIRESISSSVPKLFLGDATRIRQVISNLVSNAVRYSTDGPIEVRAFSTRHEKGALLRVELEDHGIGISPELEETLFKDFSQIQNRLTAAAQGTGLGLAISKQIIEGINGTIGVDSVLEEGSTFWFEIPVEVIESVPSKTTGKSDLSKADRRSVAGVRILLAEDNPINQKLILTFLKRMKAEVELAENGAVAVRKFAPNTFDLLLMDVAMPEMDGLEAIRTLRELYPAEDIPPIVLLTAHVMEAIHQESKGVGVARVLSKPISYDDLEAGISEVLELHQSETPSTRGVEAPSPAKADVIDMMSADVAKQLLDAMPKADLLAIVEEFISDSRRLLGEILAHQNNQNAALVAQSAHSLKGSSGSLGFPRISDAAKEIEGGITELSSERISQLCQAIHDDLSLLDQAFGKQA
ncbi:ATP-binding protein [Meridianimarinicoccus aquatilis]|uniref:histidine kinase n=1 Tax=Meridianimarinicoccus aquatilis TaxID=2552766 RepID=A0A4R6B2W6_9RHOB|nr:ATP-binding protein [Fluviibacterium aquatile]TDL90514.1 response regulator [Fluviibacterium aquatile]